MTKCSECRRITPAVQARCRHGYCPLKAVAEFQRKHAPPEVVTPPSEPIHDWFGLSRAAWLTLPRSVMQSMPEEWQQKFVALLEEASATCATHDIPIPETTVIVRNASDDTRHMLDYERGRRRLWVNTPETSTHDLLRTMAGGALWKPEE